MISFTNPTGYNAYAQPTGYNSQAMNYSAQPFSYMNQASSFPNYQTSQYSMFNPMASNSPYGGYNSYCSAPQSQDSGMMMMFTSLLMMIMGAKAKKQQPAPPPAQTTNQNSNLLQSLMSLLGGNNIANTVPVTNTGNTNNLQINANNNAQININNYGNIGAINIIQSPFTALLEKLLGQEEVEKEPDDVFIVGGYAGCTYNLGDTIGDFSSDGSGEAAWHSFDSENDDELKELLTKMSAEDKTLKFEAGYAYVISKEGKIIDKVASTQIVEASTLATGSSATENSDFKIIDDLGVDKTTGWSPTQTKNNEEAMGGQIELDETKYNVITTLIRKNTPLTFDLNGDGVKTSDKVIDFDINGDGKLDKINDVADGTLSIRGGKDGKDLFGNNTDLDADGKADGFANGFEALKALAKKEGLINGKDDMVLDSKDIKILEEKYDFGMKTEGYNSKEKSLSELGITEINLGSTDEVTEKDNFDGQNNDVLEQDGATFKINGAKRDYADVLHEIK